MLLCMFYICLYIKIIYNICYVYYINIYKWWEEDLYDLITIFLEEEIQFLKIVFLIMLFKFLLRANLNGLF